MNIFLIVIILVILSGIGISVYLYYMNSSYVYYLIITILGFCIIGCAGIRDMDDRHTQRQDSTTETGSIDSEDLPKYEMQPPGYIQERAAYVI